MTRLSSPITDLKSHYEVIVIGSGYGGGIAASRMSRCGKKVALLEKGKEFLASEFPEDLEKATMEMQLTKQGNTIGNKNGLYEFVAGKDITVFKGCGLGGTSLVNANVSIQPDPRVFEDPAWPEEIMLDNKKELMNGYARAHAMLSPSPYPAGKDGYPKLAKMEAQRTSAQAMGKPFVVPEINVTFENKINHAGIEQKKCNNCGNCVTGCNFLSKNTVNMNYIPDARNHGAEIYTEIGVSHLERTNNAWTVYFRLYHTERELFHAPDLFVTADMVFISAGSLGSTEILLRSKLKGLKLPDMLGQHFTGNGDVLGFGFDTRSAIHPIGPGSHASATVIADTGPCITSVVDTRSSAVPLEMGMTVEEGSVPGAIRSIFESMILGLPKTGAPSLLRNFWEGLVSLFRGPYTGAVDNTQIYLVMTHDDGRGTMSLGADDHLHISWPGVGDQPIFTRVNETLKAATEALGGTYVKNPLWSKIFGHDLVTVHPLGGCVMGRDSGSGVVNHMSQVYTGDDAHSVYPGLYVMDGAVVPRPLGTNPLLTISALAERSCKLIAETMDLKLSYDDLVPLQKPANSVTGVQFTETMTGYYDTVAKEDFVEGYKKGLAGGSSFLFTLTIQTPDIDGFVQDASHSAGMIGTVVAPRLSPFPLMATQGKFNLFVTSANNTKLMNYQMNLTDRNGATYFFMGYKKIHNDPGMDMWNDTTTLYISLYNGNDAQAPLLGTGILKIKMEDFAEQMKTMRAVHPADAADGLIALTKFGKLFAGNLWDTYSR